MSKQKTPVFTGTCRWNVRIEGGRAFGPAWEGVVTVTKSIGGWDCEYFCWEPCYISADNPRITWISEVTK